MELLAAFGVGVKLLHQWSVKRRMLNHLQGLIGILLGGVQHFFVKAIPTFWARDA